MRRRQVLATIATGGVVGSAGCLALGDDEDELPMGLGRVRMITLPEAVDDALPCEVLVSIEKDGEPIHMETRELTSDRPDDAVTGEWLGDPVPYVVTATTSIHERVVRYSTAEHVEEATLGDVVECVTPAVQIESSDRLGLVSGFTDCP